MLELAIVQKFEKPSYTPVLDKVKAPRKTGGLESGGLVGWCRREIIAPSMVASCCVKGCSNRKKAGCGLSFFRIPSKPIEKRNAWITIINRAAATKTSKTLKLWQPSKHSRVCSCHFETGRPHDDPQHPDYVPNQNMENSKQKRNASASQKRYERTQDRKKKRQRQESSVNAFGAASTLLMSQLSTCEEITTKTESPAYVYYDTDTDRVPSVSLPHESGGQQYPTKQEMIDADMSHRAYAAEEDDVDTPSCAVQGGNSSTISSTQEGMEDTIQATERVLQEGESIKEEPNSDDEYFLEYKDVSCSQGTQTDLTMEDVQRLYSRYSLLSCLNGGSAGIFDEIKFKNNESNVKYYTGLPDWNVLSSLVNFVNSNKSLTSIAGLTSFQEILLVLIKLRLGLADKLLSDLFGIQTPTVELIFLKVLYDMYRKLLFLIDWPDKKLIPTMPDAFLSRFGQHAVFITSCFKILVAKPCGIGDGESTHSSQKCTSSVKYLIAHTPEGSVCFLSNGWDGDQSGEYIKEHSGFLGKLEPDDIVLSGEGLGETNMEFTTGVDTHTVNLDSLSSEVQTPALEKNSSKGTDEVGAHIDKIIGSLQEEYKILTSVMPVDYLIKVESTPGVPVLIVDRIVAVCACLNNLVHLGGYMIPSS